MPRRETSDSHFISVGMFIVGISLSVIGQLITLLTGFWVFFKREDKRVRASQPEFLYLLCFGAFLVAISVIFVSFDEDKGKSKRELDSLCSAFPWFFVIGYLMMYCALFSKLWRLSKLLELRRRSLQFQQALLPFGSVVLCAILVLVIWQTTSPFAWDRKEISQGEEPYETYGECVSVRNGLLPYVIPLWFLICAAVGGTAYFSWKLRNVQSELSESRWIFAGIFLHIQTWLIGIPLLYITKKESRDASYLMYVVLAFTFATSQVCLVVWPKVYAYYLGENDTSTTTRVTISGHSQSHISGLSCQGSTKSLTASFRKNGSSAKMNGPGVASPECPPDTEWRNGKKDASNSGDSNPAETEAAAEATV